MLNIYPNIEMLIALRGIKKRAIASRLGISERCLQNKMAGKSDFTWTQAEILQREFFPDKTKEELFSKQEVS